MTERRMAAIAIAFGAGIAAADCASFACCVLLAGCLFVLALTVARSYQRPAIIILISAFVLGAARYAVDQCVPASDISNFARSVSAFEGRVASDPQVEPDRMRFVFNVSRIKTAKGWRSAAGDVMLSVYAGDDEELPKLSYRDRARITASPYPPIDPTNPGQFSYKSYLARRGIYTCASVRDLSQIKVLNRDGWRSPVGAALMLKRCFVSSISRIHPRDEASVISGVVLGTYSYLPEDTLSDFTRTGTLHVLAASGYNCFIMLWIATFIFKCVRVVPKWRWIAALLLISLYVMMVGPMPSLVRAAIMSALLLLAAPLKRVATYKNVFYASGIILLAITPSNLFDVGFQLSFAAVYALISVAPILEAMLSRTALGRIGSNRKKMRGNRHIARIRAGMNRHARELVAVAVATTAVTFVTGPIVAYHFNYISLTAMPANMAVALLVPVIFADGLASIITCHLPYAHLWMGIIGTWSTRAMVGAVHFFGSMSYSAVSVQSPPILAIAGYYVVLYAVMSYLRSKFAER